MQKLLYLSIAMLFIACQSKELQKQDDSYAAIAKAMHENGQLNGTVCVVEDGKLVYEGAFGFSNLDPVDSLEPGDVFRLGSVSKQFTAAAILLLQQDEKLSVEDKLTDHIPELPYEGIHLRHLLNHTSGLPDYENLMFREWKPELAIEDPIRYISGNQDVIDMLVEKQPEIYFEPGEKWEYSNTGYLLLASIVERVSGMSFADFLKQRIFDPLEMNNSSVYAFVAGNDPDFPKRVYGYRMGDDGKTWVRDDSHFLNPVAGDGGVYSNLEDLRKWDKALYSDDLLTSFSKSLAFKPAPLNDDTEYPYGFGWFINYTPENTKIVRHSGGWVGFRTGIYRDLGSKSSIIVLTNNSSRYTGDVSAQMRRIMLGEEAYLPPIFIGEVMQDWIKEEGYEKAIQRYKEARKKEDGSYRFVESELNVLGYQLMWSGDLEAALAILSLNNEEYPESANTYDSKGDIYLAMGDTLAAYNLFVTAYKMDENFWISKEKADKIKK